MPLNNAKLIRSKLALQFNETDGWRVYTTLNGSSANPDFRWMRITEGTAAWYKKTFPDILIIGTQTESTK